MHCVTTTESISDAELIGLATDSVPMKRLSLVKYLFQIILVLFLYIGSFSPPILTLKSMYPFVVGKEHIWPI